MNSVKGWCPSGHRPMMSGDGLIVRMRPPMLRLTADQVALVAGMAARYGNGMLEVTNRASLQIRGVAPADHTPLLAALIKADLVPQDAVAETRSHMVVTPLWAKGDMTHRVAMALLSALFAADDLALSAKFGFAVDCGPVPVLRDTPADIRVERLGDACRVIPDGREGVIVAEDEVPQTVLRLARWFMEMAVEIGGPRRMRALLAQTAAPDWARGAGALPAGATPQVGPQTAGILAGLPFGLITASELAQITAPIRLTPWGGLLIEGAAPDFAITDPDNPLLRIRACTGAPGCPSAHADTRAMARALAPELPPSMGLHLSGCGKSCASKAAHDVTLIATPDGFDLVLGGKVSDKPLQTGLDKAEAMAAARTAFAGGPQNAV